MNKTSTMASTNTGNADGALRFADLGMLPKRMLAAIEGYEHAPLVSLEEAVKPLVDIVPKVERNVFVVKQNCNEPDGDLSTDESASVMLYTLESVPHENSLYAILNATLRSEQRQKLIPWFLYLRLVLTALARLPSERHFVVRGVKADLRAEYPKGSTFIWWGFSSCTSSIEVLESEQFFGKSGTRTLFQIDCQTGKSIKNHSFIQQEDEILLPPARQFHVTSCLDSGNGLHIIQLKEIQPPFPLLEPVPLLNPTLQPKNKFSTKIQTKTEQPNRTPAVVPKMVSQNKSITQKKTEGYAGQNQKLRDLIDGCQEGFIIDLQNQNVKDEDMTLVTKQAILNKQCTQLWLNKNKITSHGVSVIADTLTNNTTLMRLDLSYNCVCDIGVQSLATALSLNKSVLTALFLHSTHITDEGANHIADMLKINRTLTELMLSQNKIGDQGFQFLSNILTHHNSTLTSLDLLDNKPLNDSTIDSLCRMLKHNQSLRSIYISSYNLPNDGQQRITDAFLPSKRCSLTTYQLKL